MFPDKNLALSSSPSLVIPGSGLVILSLRGGGRGGRVTGGGGRETGVLRRVHRVCYCHKIRTSLLQEEEDQGIKVVAKMHSSSRHTEHFITKEPPNSGTSDNGHSEEWTTSLQWTHLFAPCLYYCPYISTSEEGTTSEQWTKHSSPMCLFPIINAI